MYLVKTIQDKIDVEVLNTTITMPLSFADGMIGALPVFSTREDAIAFAECDESLVLQIYINEKETK